MMKTTNSREYFFGHIVTVGKERVLREICTLTGHTCLRGNHDCENCERGDVARKWEAKYGKPLLPDPTKSTDSARK